MRRHYLTVRRLPPDLADALEAEKKRRGTSLNETVLRVLSEGLGVRDHRRSNGLGELAGEWSAEDFEAFEKAIATTEQIDEDDWR